MELVPDIDRLTQIFSNAVAPSFFLGAIAAFVSLMMSRLAAVNARINATRALPDQDRSAVGSSMALRPLTRRARLLNDGIILSLGGGVCATLLLAVLFASQFFGLKHVYGAGILFFLATLLLGVALFRFAQEAWLHYRIMTRLHEQGRISDGNFLEFLQSHTNVMFQPDFDDPRFSGFSPYALGFAIMQDIERIVSNPDNEDREWFPETAGIGDVMAVPRYI